MSINIPPISDLCSTFPQVSSLAIFNTGGFKIVFRATISGETEALKLIPLPPLSQDEQRIAYRIEALGRIRREYQALSSCLIPELVKLGSLPLTECNLAGIDYIAYSEEFLSGRDLNDIIRNDPNIPNEIELKLLSSCLLRAIRELWNKGYIHRDIKPANVIKLGVPTRPFVLLDLGIAQSISETALTYNPTARLPVATYRYMAPERANPLFRDRLDFRSDLYSAALTVYEYATKNHPYARNADDDVLTISRAINVLPSPLKSTRSDLDEAFCQLIDQMLRKKPALRPSNLEQLLAFMGG